MVQVSSGSQVVSSKGVVPCKLWRWDVVLVMLVIFKGRVVAGHDYAIPIAIIESVMGHCNKKKIRNESKEPLYQ